MKKFLLRLTTFFIVLSLLFLISYQINKALMNSDIATLNKNANTLIIGDSHTVFSCDPEYIENSVNVSQVAEPYIVTYFKLKTLLAQNPQIKKVVLGFSYHNFSAFNDKKFEDAAFAGNIWDQYYPLLSLKTVEPLEINKKVYFTRFIRHCMLPNADYVLNKVKNTGRTYPYIGNYRTSDTSHIGEVSVDSIISRHYYDQGSVLGISATSVDYFEKMMTLTQEKGVTLYLVCTPLHPDYIAKVPENIQFVFDSLAREAAQHKHVTFIDLSKDVQNDNLFTDYDHLNTLGAQPFSNKINTLLN